MRTLGPHTVRYPERGFDSAQTTDDLAWRRKGARRGMGKRADAEEIHDCGERYRQGEMDWMG